MRMSISTTSGRSSLCERDGLVAVLRFADDLEIVLHLEDRAEARPHECLVVGDEDADHAVPAGSRARTANPPSIALPVSSVPPYSRTRSRMPVIPWPPFDPFARPSTVVEHLELDVVAAVANRHPRLRGPRVLERVRQRLLHDPVGGEVDAGRQRPRLALDRELDGQADAAHLLDQRVELCKAGLRPERGLAVGAAQQAEHAPKLAERLAPRARDRDEGLARTVGIVLEQRLARLGLHHHRADAVRHDVVQLARQPGALVGDRRALSCLLLACERSRAGGSGGARSFPHPRRRRSGPRRRRRLRRPRRGSARAPP